MEIWYVLIFLRLTVPRCVLMRSPRFWKVGRMFPRWSELDAFDRFHHTVYQRISSLDLVRAKPHKNTKLIFTVIIRCLVLLCWTLSHFSNTFPTKGTQLDTTTLIIWKNIDTRERESEIKGRFFLLFVVTLWNKICYFAIKLSSVLQNRFLFLKNLIVLMETNSHVHLVLNMIVWFQTLKMLTMLVNFVIRKVSTFSEVMDMEI